MEFDSQSVFSSDNLSVIISQSLRLEDSSNDSKEQSEQNTFQNSTHPSQGDQEQSILDFTQSQLKEYFSETDPGTCPSTCSKNSFRGSEKDASKARRKVIKKHGRGRINVLFKIRRILTEIFSGKEINLNDWELKAYEKSLLKYTLMKKATRRDESCPVSKAHKRADLTNDLLKELINNLNYSEKRKDEIIKMIFKQSLKALKTLFLYEHSFKSQEEGEISFLYHYFSKESETEKLPIMSYADPFSNNVDNPWFKGLTVGYLRQIFKSECFKSDFFEYMDYFLVGEYHEKIYVKVSKLLKSLRMKMKKVPVHEEEKVVISYINGRGLGKKQGLKYPWTDFEVKNAIQVFKKHVKYVLKEKSNC